MDKNTLTEKTIQKLAFTQNMELDKIISRFKDEGDPQKFIAELKGYMKEKNPNQKEKFNILHNLNFRKEIPLNLVDSFYSLFY